MHNHKSFLNLILILILFLFFNCSNDDDQDVGNNSDERYKIIFNQSKDISIIGDTSNERLWQFTIQNQIWSILGYHIDDETGDLYIASNETVNSGFNIGKLNPIEVMENEQNFSPMEKVFEFDFFDQEILVHFEMVDKDRFFMITDTNSSLVYREYNFSGLISTINLNEYGISAFYLRDVDYEHKSNTLIIFTEEFQSTDIIYNRIDLTDLSSTKINLPGNVGLIKCLETEFESYLLLSQLLNGVSSSHIYDIEGNYIIETSRSYIFQGSWAMVYDKVDKRFEYFERGDGINNFSTLEVPSGLVEYTTGGSNIAGPSKKDMLLIN